MLPLSLHDALPIFSVCPTSGSVTVTWANGVVVWLSLMLIGLLLHSIDPASLTEVATTVVVAPLVVAMPSNTLIEKLVVTLWPGVTWFAVGVNTSPSTAA